MSIKIVTAKLLCMSRYSKWMNMIEDDKKDDLEIGIIHRKYGMARREETEQRRKQRNI